MILAIVLDQGSKAYALYHLNLTQVENIRIFSFFSLGFVKNTGITFGLLNNLGVLGPFVLVGVALMVFLFLLKWLLKTQDIVQVFSLGLVAKCAWKYDRQTSIRICREFHKFECLGF